MSSVYHINIGVISGVQRGALAPPGIVEEVQNYHFAPPKFSIFIMYNFANFLNIYKIMLTLLDIISNTYKFYNHELQIELKIFIRIFKSKQTNSNNSVF